MESIVKPVVKVGNSAGVVLPIEWYGGEARIELIKKPLNIKEEVLKALDNYMESILGIYIVGSYARREEEDSSDIDVLVITSDINKRIRKGKYEILLISLDEVKNALKIIVPIIPMIYEAVPILNKKLLDELKDYKIKKQDLKWHLQTTKSSLNTVREILNLNEEKVKGEVIYPLILRLREAYIVDCLLKNKKYSKKDFLEMLKRNKIYELYEEYNREKRGKKARAVSREKAEITYDIILNYLKKQTQNGK